MASTPDIIAQVERVLAKFPNIHTSWYVSNVASGFRDTAGYVALRTECIALGNFVYGEGHVQARTLARTLSQETLHNLKSAEGILRGTIEALKHGLLTELRTQVLLDIKTDFVAAAVRAVDSGGVQVAAVLAAAVLEDSTKRLVEKHGLDDMLDKEFSVVVAGLFRKGVVTKTTKDILLGYKDLRNAALHAQWAQVSEDGVRNLLHYLPQFMEQYEV